MRSAYSAKDFAVVTLLGERVMRLNLPDVSVQSWLALSYYNLKMYPDCIRACEFLLGAGYDVEAVLYYESRALSKLARYDESNELLQTCLKKAIEPTAEWYYNDRAENFEAQHRYKLALSNYDTAYYMFRSPLMLYNAGRVAETGLKDVAVSGYRPAGRCGRTEGL
jgi:tetratricopeptide (TPR) repeat protein